LLVEVWGSEEEIVSLMERLLKELIVLEGVTLELHHLLEVADAAVSHFG
jgi:hypothetical protein